MAKYDLEDRTARFAENCRKLIRHLEKDISNVEDCKQLARASASVAANYIEVNEAISKRDRIFKARLCRRESKESKLFLTLIFTADSELAGQKAVLADEASQLTKIFNTIIGKLGGDEPL